MQPDLADGRIAAPVHIGRVANSYPWIVLLLVTILTILSYVDRQLLVLLAPHIQRDLAISDTGMGLLLGVAFALLYGFAALPAGVLADRISRRNIMLAGLVFWSCATIACGLAEGYGQLFMARMAVGIGEACLGPAAISLLADYFAPEKRGHAFGIFQMGSIIGAGIALVGGGALLSLLNDAGSVDVLGHSITSWKLIFLVMGGVGLIYAPFVLLVREPSRLGQKTPVLPQAAQGTRQRTFWRTHARLVILAYLLFACCAFLGFGINSWLPSLIVREYDIPLSRAGLLVGGVIVAAGICGALFGGWLGDRFSCGQSAGRRLDAILVSWVLSLAAVIALCLELDLSVLLAVLAVFGLSNTMMVAMAPAVLSEIFPANLRGTGMAIYFLNLSIFGMALGPLAVALVNDNLFAGHELRLSFGVIGLPTALIALLIGLSMRRAFGDHVGKA